jgi:excinuclease ABC subunit A
VRAPAKRFMPVGAQWTRAQLEALPGLTVHDLMLLPIDRLRASSIALSLPSGRSTRRQAAARRDPHAPALPVRRRPRLPHARPPVRTLSGGEVQRINLTTALGTSLVNTLFVLDEPSIGLHPRDMGRIIEVMQRLRDAGNTLVVVEHDPQSCSPPTASSTWARAPASAAARSCSTARPTS